MSLDYRLKQDKAQKDVERGIAVDRAIGILRNYMLAAGPYDKIEVLIKQNGQGFTIRMTQNQQEEIDFKRSD